ncbi:MAG: AMP-binding protein [Anaerolineae bacterium]|nr:AMP-binding protein [Anaerolineae bacterium]
MGRRSRRVRGWTTRLPNPLRRVDPRHVLAAGFRLLPNAEFLVAGERRLTRRQVWASVEALAAGLQARGIEAGDRVVTLLPAGPEAVYAMLAPWLIGTVEVPLHPLLRAHELRHILADCEARAVLTTRRWRGHDYPAMLAALLPDLPDLRAVVVHGGEGDGHTFFSLDEVMAVGKPLRRVCVSRHDVGRIAYTSGTSGLPKGVMHARDGYWGLLHPAAAPRLDPRLLRCLLLPFPPCYYSGWLGIVAALLSGGKVVLADRFHPRHVLETIEHERVSLLAASPTMCRLLLGVPGQGRYDLSSVRHVILGTEPMPFDLAQAVHERLGCSLEQVYGSNEVGYVTWTGLHDPWQVAATTVGRPVPGARLRIVDDDRRPLPTGARGEIAVQTAQMMRGYYRDPALTARVLDGDGWFYTGDVGYVGEDGYLRLVDRKRDLIIRGGQNVYPAEVEIYLQGHPLVRRAGVVGVARGSGGEEVWAFVELLPGARLTPTDVLNFCRGQIAPYKIPDEVRFVERLPTTVTDKVQRYRLREMADDELRLSAP